MTRTIRSPGHVALVDALIHARRAAGLTQVQLANRLRVHQSFIARIETGQRRIDVSELIILSRAIGVKPAVLVDIVAKSVPEDAAL